MDYIALIIAAILFAIAITFVLLNFAPAPADIAAQDASQVTVKGYCGSEDCIAAAIRECSNSETVVTRANLTQIITVGGNGTYQGRPVCMISINEVSPAGDWLRSVSCKALVSELRNLTATDLEALGGRLASAGHCGQQVP